MGLARKCDICGKLYEHYFIDVNGYKVNAIHFIGKQIPSGEYFRDEPTDLCQECLGSIFECVRSLSPDKGEENGG